MIALSPLARRVLERLRWVNAGEPPLLADAVPFSPCEINVLVAAVESLVLAAAYGDIPKPADDFQRQLDMLAEAHGARLAALERTTHTHAD